MKKHKASGWVLRLKEDISKEHHEGKTLYLSDDDSEDFLTEDLQNAEVYVNKELTIENMKKHEENILSQFGSNSVCNFGYTNMMRNFDFVEVVGG